MNPDEQLLSPEAMADMWRQAIVLTNRSLAGLPITKLDIARLRRCSVVFSACNQIIGMAMCFDVLSDKEKATKADK